LAGRGYYIIMALVDPAKKGGPYTKKDQEERRGEVFRLHFEHNYSAVKIADILHANRNTINEDIRYWHLQFSKELENSDLSSWAVKQIHSLESQKSRLLDKLEKQNDFDEKMSIEKLIFNIDDKISEIIIKILPKNKTVEIDENEIQEIREEAIKDICLYILKKQNFDIELCTITDGEIWVNIIELLKCETEYAILVCKKMNRLGLGLCTGTDFIRTDPFTPSRYNILKFSLMREFITIDEIEKLRK